MPPDISDDARWYLADLVSEIRVEGDSGNLVHVNMHLIEACSPDEAFDKAMALGKQSELVYANSGGDEVRTVFRGLRNLTAIEEPLQDGAELAYDESINVPEAKLASSLTAKDDLAVFSKRKARHELMQFVSGATIKQLKDAGVTPEQLTDET